MFEGFADVSTSVDGIEIHAIRCGRGPVLLLLHDPEAMAVGLHCRLANSGLSSTVIKLIVGLAFANAIDQVRRT